MSWGGLYLSFIGALVCKLEELQRQVDLQGVFVKIGDLLN